MKNRNNNLISRMNQAALSPYHIYELCNKWCFVANIQNIPKLKTKSRIFSVTLPGLKKAAAYWLNCAAHVSVCQFYQDDFPCHFNLQFWPGWSRLKLNVGRYISLQSNLKCNYNILVLLKQHSITRMGKVHFLEKMYFVGKCISWKRCIS